MSEKHNLDPAVHKTLADNTILAVMVSNDPESAVSTGAALLKGGVKAVELALRTPRALECAKALTDQLPDLLVVAGTVLTTGQLDQLSEIGVKSAVAPGMNRAVVEHALSLGMSFAPGICTPSDIEAALECGCRTLKYFPAEPSGGLTMLNSMAGPYLHLGLDFIPLGGLKAVNLEEYLSSDLILAIGGSWICPADLIESENYAEIEKRAREASDAARKVRGE